MVYDVRNYLATLGGTVVSSSSRALNSFTDNLAKLCSRGRVLIVAVMAALFALLCHVFYVSIVCILGCWLTSCFAFACFFVLCCATPVLLLFLAFLASQ
ncbi:hypothetical protein Q3G72_017535 [Acer saccharum]|nr:hypothetical protein Q3G72_017535 [Acer saccharum]